MPKTSPDMSQSPRPTTADGEAQNSPRCDSEDDALRARLIADIAGAVGLPALIDALNTVITDRFSASTAKTGRRDR